jgi:transposase
MSERKKSTKKLKKDPFAGLPPLNLNAAGIDIGNAAHYVAVPADRDSKPVRKFDCFTADLRRLANWLEQCGIETVAMESTGVYWIPLFQILEERGFDVKLVNARHVKNLPGRKTDMLDCQWLQKLHAFGLLNNSFRPTDQICILRSYWRQRENLIAATSTCVQHMQKALTEMNIQLANVISDLSGYTGLAIVRAILGGERDPQKLAELRHERIQATKEEIAKSLEGNWREELLFNLRQSLEIYDLYQQKIDDCDRQINRHMQTFQSKVDQTVIGTASKRRKKVSGNVPGFDLPSELHRITGVDLTRINGINAVTAQTIISEIGLDMTKWKTEKNFASWLGLCPDNTISGGRVLKRGTRKVINRAAVALRMAAHALLRSKSALGSNYRRLRTQLGAPKAITAMAHKLARLVYRMLRYGSDYVDKGIAHYEAKYQQTKLAWLKKKAAELNMILIPTTTRPRLSSI